jgi:glycosyltransferase involved in cell wall biosynthesis
MRRARIALVTQDLSERKTGVGTLVQFLHDVLRDDERFETDLVSMATGARDEASMRLLTPSSWRPPRVVNRSWHGVPFRHVGAWTAELEFQRYRRRRALDRLLAGYDLVQFVVGAPYWAAAALHLPMPVLVWTASLAMSDRATRLRSAKPAVRMAQGVMTRLVMAQETRVLEKADTIFALSEYTREAIRQRVGGERVRLAPVGVDHERFRPPPDAAERYLLTVGRLSDPRKNIALLLRAYALMRERGVRMPFVLAGAPPDSATLRLAADLGVLDHLTLAGELPDEALPALYQDAALFMLSSDEEGLGIPILEAMACGVPVVSTACGGPGTTVLDGVTGYLTPVGDAAALAAAACEVLGDQPRRRAMGNAGRLRVEREFSLARIARIFVDRYIEVLGTESTASRSSMAASQS